MSVTVSDFGKMQDGRPIYLYTIENAGMKACVTNFGAILVSLFVPDGKGNTDDLVLGFDKGEDYFHNGSFFGATVGRNANRIAGAKFAIAGKTYQLAVNDNENNLHSDFEKGFHMQYWSAITTDDSVRFSYQAQDMETGFPGNLDISVTYTLTPSHELILHYEGVSDQKTLINLTNHSYFNLYGHDHGSISDTLLQLDADKYTPVVAGAIPTGELASVSGTPMDFREWKEIGKEIDADFEQLKLVQGYDHNFVISGYNGKLRRIAGAKAAGREMTVYSDLPGVQFYAGNCIAPCTGKGGVQYGPRYAFCLETQYFPNSANQEGFEKPFFDAGEKYDTVTIYQFAWE
ncbi:MAG: galactose mutarotase [Lachnospiraceae bacterium]|nr:galactose mutarotase [Lachnospiraceae bacterium]